MAVGDKGDVVAKRDGAAHRGVDAELRHAAADDEMGHGAFRQPLDQIGLEERIGAPLVNDGIIAAGCEFLPDFPAFRADREAMARIAVVLYEDDGDAAMPCAFPERREARDGLIKRGVD